MNGKINYPRNEQSIFRLAYCKPPGIHETVVRRSSKAREKNCTEQKSENGDKLVKFEITVDESEKKITYVSSLSIHFHQQIVFLVQIDRCYSLDFLSTSSYI